MTTLWFDCETYSECDLKAHGTHRYAEHPSTEITVAQWAIDDGEPVVEDLTGARRVPSDALYLALANATAVVAHNSAFDRTLTRHCWSIDAPIERWRDTMVKAYAHGLPGSLGKVGEVLGLPLDQQKDRRGAQLIQLFCKPRPKGHTIRRATRETHPAEWAEFLAYSRQDIVSMREIDRRLPSWNYRAGHAELALWHLDQRINDRGFAVDVDLANAAIAAVAAEQARLKKAVQDATLGEVSGPSKRDDMLRFILEAYGVELPDFKADTLRRRLEDPELPDGVKLLISLRLEATKTSTAKYKALVNAVSADGRLRNTSQFAGAQRTARWAHRLFQPGNMPRPNMHLVADALGVKLKDLSEEETLIWQEAAISSIKAGTVTDYFDDVMGVTSNLIRGCIVAPPGRKLCVADLSNIEGRGLAELAGEEWKLRAFAAFDAGTGADLYKLAYARSFNVDPATATGQKRQIGKVMELGCLAGNTPVVTSNGVKAITAVLSGDLLWDGEEWVTHDGLLEKGVKPVVSVAGIELTPDHLVLIGQTWTPALALASSEGILCRALATGTENSPSWLADVSKEVRASWTWQTSSARAARRRTPSSPTTSAKEPAHGVTPVPRSRLGTGARSFMGTLASWKIKVTDLVCSTAYPLASTVATTQTTAGSTATAAAAFSCTSLGEKIVARFSATWSVLKAGTDLNLNSTEKTSTRATSQATCASSQSARTTPTAAPCGNCSSESPNSKPTFDILNAGPRNRFTVLTEQGPLVVHNCGYEGGVAAFLTFAAVYQMDLTEMADAVHTTAPKDVLAKAYGMWEWATRKKRTLGLEKNVYVACESVKAMWRSAHPATVALWAAAGEAVRSAIANPGVTFDIGPRLKAQRDGAWLRVRLPSGRYLCYLQPQVADDGQISYMGVNQYTRQWCRIKTYGGKLIENATQAWARDVLAYNMPAIDGAGYEILVTIHDELLTETPDNESYSADVLAEMMSRRPPWAPTVPLAAAGFETDRYRKG